MRPRLVSRAHRWFAVPTASGGRQFRGALRRRQLPPRDTRGRRRRRRGGRGRNRDRGPRPEGASQEAAPQESRAADENGQADAPSTHQADIPAPEAGNGQSDNGDFAASGNGLQAPGDGGRRRRRRRGRRGGRNRDQDNQDRGSLAPEAERFGVPEEIDTTPVLGHAPGAPSAPVWSLKDDVPDTTPTDDASKPAKKGWWQRTFSGE